MSVLIPGMWWSTVKPADCFNFVPRKDPVKSGKRRCKYDSVDRCPPTAGSLCCPKGDFGSVGGLGVLEQAMLSHIASPQSFYLWGSLREDCGCVQLLAGFLSPQWILSKKSDWRCRTYWIHRAKQQRRSVITMGSLKVGCVLVIHKLS